MKGLKREDIIQVIEGKGAAKRVPLLMDLWIYDNVFDGKAEKRTQWLSQYPCDVKEVFLHMPGMFEAPAEDSTFCWTTDQMTLDETKGLDAQSVIQDWEKDGEEFYRTFPSAESPALITEKPNKEGQYLLGRWWYCLFERLWSLRGMENALMDFYLYPEEIHKLFRYLTDFYMRAMERAKEELDVDGFFVSDDIGTQAGPFFSLDIFREFFKPYYKEIIEKAHSLGTHFWLHSCGNIELFLPDFIEIGLDVIHPIQKYTMDEKEIAEKYGNQICILAGFDVQNTIPFGTTEDVEKEVRFLKDTYQKPEGRFMLTMGNGSTVDWKISSLDMLYKTALEEKKYESDFVQTGDL